MTGYPRSNNKYSGITREELDRFLVEGRDQDRKKYKYATWVRREGDSIVVKLHNTDIMTFHPNNSIKLDSGGWRTVTTKARMNEFLPRCWMVYQENNIWYVAYRKADAEKDWTFEDGIVLFQDGRVTGAGPDKKWAESLNKQINAYARRFAEKMLDGEIPPPSSGDCWYCLLKDEDGKPFGEGKDHILDHIRSKYYVPSLLVNALNSMPVSKATLWAVQGIWEGNDDALFAGKDWTKKRLKSAIARYIRRQVGLAS